MAFKSRPLIWVLSTIIFSSIHGEEDVEMSKQYTLDTFQTEIVKNNHFIMFYAPWCTHCKRLHPTWEELAKMYNRGSSDVTIAKVDCTTDTALCSEHDVTGYPTLKFFGLNQKEIIKFRQTRDLPTLTNFISEQLGISDSELKDNDDEGSNNGLVELTDENYEKILSKGSHFVKFYAPWCGHCQRLAPTWDTLAQSYTEDSGITISKLDCTVNREACKTFDIKSYPTLLWIQEGKKMEKYEGGRTGEELRSWVSEMRGNRGVEGKTGGSELPLSPVVSLTADTFDDQLRTGITFVKFFAPWCGHCKRLAQTWEELGRKFATVAWVDIAKVDCTLQHNKELCNQQEVDGFPTLILYKNGEKLSEYTGLRGLEELYDFVEKHSAHDEL